MQKALPEPCCHEKLVKLVEKQFRKVDDLLEVFDHLDKCTECRNEVYLMVKAKDYMFLIYKPYRPPKRKKTRPL